jgi:diguanylate cyclase (GGDEF)-like protein
MRRLRNLRESRRSGTLASQSRSVTIVRDLEQCVKDFSLFGVHSKSKAAARKGVLGNMYNGLKHPGVGLIGATASAVEAGAPPDSASVEASPPVLGDDELETRQIDELLARRISVKGFPAELEARFQHDHAAPRMRRMMVSGALVAFLFNWLLVSDAVMVPDQFDLAIQLRLLLYTPLTLLGLWLVNRIASIALREWAVLAASVAAAAINVTLCLRSGHPNAGPYLVSLASVVVFTNTVARIRFTHAVWLDTGILIAFVWATLRMPDAPMDVMLPAGVMLMSLSVFTLYGCHALEQDERRNWLMRQRELALRRALQQANVRLDAASRHDLLTDVANRRHFEAFLEEVWEHARQSGQDVSLMLLDIDRFKDYNAHHGQAEGDACLRQIAAVLKLRLRRPDDLVARYGGEEFAAVLVGTPVSVAVGAAERIRQGVTALARPHASSPTGHVTVSIGVACMRPNAPHASQSQLIAAADEALHQAKRRGGDQVFAFGTQG